MFPKKQDRSQRKTFLPPMKIETLKAFFEFSNDAIVFTDMNGRCVDANPAAVSLFGTPQKDLVGRSLTDFLESGIASGFREGGFFQGEHRILRADGTSVDVDSSLITDVRSELNLIVLRDITERKQMERTLEDTEDWQRNLIDHAPDPILVYQDERIAYCNSAALSFYKADSFEQFVSLSPFSFIHPAERELASTEIESVLNGGCIALHNFRHLRLDGEEVPVEVHIAPMMWKRRPAVHVIIHDVSRRKKAEEAVQESELRMARAQQLAHLGSWEVDLVTNELTWSDEVYRIFGLRPRETAPTLEGFLERVHPEDRAAVRRCYSESVQNGKETYEIVHRIIREGTGEVRWVHEKCENIRDESGTVIRSGGMVLDITSHIRADAQREFTANMLRLLNQSSYEMPILIRNVLRLLKDWTGFDAVGLRMRREGDCPYYYQIGFPDDFIEQEMSLCAKGDECSSTHGEAGETVFNCTCGLVLSGFTNSGLPFFTDGGSFWTNNSSELLNIPRESDPRKNPRNKCIDAGYLSVAIIPVRSGSEIIGLLQLNDRRKNQFTPEDLRFFEGLGDQLGISLKRIQVQEELKILNQSLERQVAERTSEIRERSEQLRLLALELAKTEQRERQRLAEILHEGLQQVLVAAKYRLALFKTASDPIQLANEVAAVVDEAIEISRSLTAELSPPIVRQSGLIAGLEWLRRWMRQKHGLAIDLRIHNASIALPQDLSFLLFQVVKELLFNVVKHSGVHAARLELVQHDDQIRITVDDEGSGFDQTRLRAAGGSDQGFGLFSINERIATVGGLMNIVSAPGQGTRISLSVPLLPSDSEVLQTIERDDKGSPRMEPRIIEPTTENKIRIVLVDDHRVVRHGLAGLVQKEPDMEIIGEASDGESALTIVRDLKPDVVLMDISMPKMDGIQATSFICSEMSDVRVIGLSMFEEGEQALAMRKAGAAGYVSKSGPSDQLIRTIRSVMKGSVPKVRLRSSPL